MEDKGKHYDFEKVCVDKDTAQHVLDSVINEYKDNEKWTIGKQEIIEMPNGEYKVFVELTFKENENTMKF